MKASLRCTQPCKIRKS